MPVCVCVYARARVAQELRRPVRETRRERNCWRERLEERRRGGGGFGAAREREGEREGGGEGGREGGSEGEREEEREGGRDLGR